MESVYSLMLMPLRNIVEIPVCWAFLEGFPPLIACVCIANSSEDEEDRNHPYIYVHQALLTKDLYILPVHLTLSNSKYQNFKILFPQWVKIYEEAGNNR